VIAHAQALHPLIWTALEDVASTPEFLTNEDEHCRSNVVDNAAWTAATASLFAAAGDAQ
jgi:hypothetical protein